MKNKNIFYCGTIISIIAVAFFTLGNAGGPPSGFTGSPGDNGKTCGSNGGCHTGNTVISQAGWITSDIPVTGYLPDSTYTITAMVTHLGVTKFGFQLSPQDSLGTKLGTLTAGTGTKLVGGNKYIEQIASGTSGMDSRSWTFNWTAPSQGTGDVIFYAAFNATNKNGGTSGDQVYLSSLTVQEAITADIPWDNPVNDILIFPNPNNGIFNMQFPSAGKISEISIYNLAGIKIFNTKKTDAILFPIDISEYGSGIYYLNIISGKESVTKRIMVIL